MGGLQRYLQIFEGEPLWVILLASVVMVTGAVVIVEKVFKFSLWLTIVGLVAGLVMFVGSWLLFW